MRIAVYGAGGVGGHVGAGSPGPERKCALSRAARTCGLLPSMV